MNDATPNPARPVSAFTIVLLFVVFGLFFFIVRHYYHPVTALPNTMAPENLAKEQEWRATRESRRATLNELRATQQKEIDSYGWVDQKAGVVRLPIERAMELTAQQYGGQK